MQYLTPIVQWAVKSSSSSSTRLRFEYLPFKTKEKVILEQRSVGFLSLLPACWCNEIVLKLRRGMAAQREEWLPLLLHRGESEVFSLAIEDLLHSDADDNAEEESEGVEEVFSCWDLLALLSKHRLSLTHLKLRSAATAVKEGSDARSKELRANMAQNWRLFGGELEQLPVRQYRY